jgi:hypothetical protein
MRVASPSKDYVGENPQEPRVMPPSPMTEASFSEDDSDSAHETHDVEEHCILPSSIHGPSVHGATFGDAVVCLRTLMNPRKSPARKKGATARRAYAVPRPVKPKTNTMRPSSMRGASMSPVKSRRMVVVSFGNDDDVPELPFEPVEIYRPNGILRPTSIRETPFGDDDGIECGPSFEGIVGISECSNSFDSDDDVIDITAMPSFKAPADASGVSEEPSTKPKGILRQRQPLVRRKSFSTARKKNSFGTAVTSLKNFINPRRKSGAAQRMVVRDNTRPQRTPFGDDDDSSVSGESFGYDEYDVQEKTSIKPKSNLRSTKPRRKSFGEAMARLRVLMSPRRKSTGHTNHCAPRMELRTLNTPAWESPRSPKSERKKLASQKPHEPVDYSKRSKSPRRKLKLRREKSREPEKKINRPTNAIKHDQPVVPTPTPVRVKVKKVKKKEKDRSKSPAKPSIIPNDDSDRGFAFTPSYIEPSAEMTDAEKAEKRRKCKEAYKWYARMGQPNCAEMKRRVAAMPKSCNIDATYIDCLPWTPGFKRLSVIEMNKIYLADK